MVTGANTALGLAEWAAEFLASTPVCELNRQIKADNALLRELRGQVKKLAQAVRNTLPALAEAMENLRKNLLLFCYQLGYLRKGKERLNTSLNTLRPALTQYNQLTKDIQDKTKERRSLLSEKKALSAVHVFRHRELAAKIAALTEDLEELRSEKNLLLVSLAYSEEDAADKFPKDIAAMEQSLKRLEEQEKIFRRTGRCPEQVCRTSGAGTGLRSSAALRNKTGNPPRQGAGSGEPGTAGLRREVQPAFDV